MVTRDQLVKAIESLGGAASEDELLKLAPPGEKGALLDELRLLESDDVLECDVAITWRTV
jgi:hypothetical protein